MANNSEDRSSFVTMLISVAFVLVTAISNIIAGKIHALSPLFSRSEHRHRQGAAVKDDCKHCLCWVYRT